MNNAQTIAAADLTTGNTFKDGGETYRVYAVEPAAVGSVCLWLHKFPAMPGIDAPVAFIVPAATLINPA